MDKVDFAIPDEYRQMQLLVRKYVQTELIPLENIVYERGEISRDLWSELVAKSKALGLYAPFAPEEYGGAGLNSCLAYMLMSEEMGRTIDAFKYLVGLGYETGADVATKEQLGRYYSRIWQGTSRFFVAVTEPDAGTDVLGMKSTAVRRGDGWVINGSKLFISHFGEADWGIIFALTDKAKRRVSAFLIETNTPGLTGRRLQTMGVRGQNLYEVFMDECFVPQSSLLGEEGKGLRLFMGYLDLIRMRVGVRGLGVAQRCLEMTLDYVKQRKIFGKPLATFQALQFMLVDLWMEIETTRSLLLRAYAEMDNNGRIYIPDSCACKVLGSEVGGGM